MAKKLDLTGQVFGLLTAQRRIAGSRKRKAKWRCVCKCGNVTDVATTYLRTGYTKSCGCLRNISHIQGLAGQRFGRLVVIGLKGITKTGHSKWLCQCDCGNKTITLSAYLKHKQTFSCGCYHTEVIKRQRKQDRITPENIRLRHSFAYTEWRMAIYERDGYKCQCCNNVGGELNAHHILSWSKYPELRYDVNNGITLCRDCHFYKIHKFIRRAI